MNQSVDKDCHIINQTWPADGLETVEQCPVCGGKERSVLYQGLTDRVFFCAPGEWTLYRCQGCASAYLDPRPTPDSVGRAYSRYFTHNGSWRKPIEELSLPKRILRSVANGYFNHRFHTNFIPENKFSGRLIALIFPNQKKNWDVIGRHLPTTDGQLRLLDIGCGNGGFLEFSREMGWHASGIDFDPSAIAVCRKKNLDVQCGGIGLLDESSEQFDWITMSHVIEHVHEPGELLLAAYRLLKPRGYLWLSTPNLDAMGHQRFGRHWRGLEPPRHLILFTRNSLINLLKKTGYSEVRDAPFYPVYKTIAQQSRIIQKGGDPMSAEVSKWPTVESFFADIRGIYNPNDREFVTLIARKPQ